MSKGNEDKIKYLRESLKMWQWIATTTLSKKTKIFKEDYFTSHNKEYSKVKNDCFLCEYANLFGDNSCRNCPVKEWAESDRNVPCECDQSPYLKWENSIHYSKAYQYAYDIINLLEWELKCYLS